MTTKSIGAHVWGPEDRVVSANLDSGYFVEYASTTETLVWAYKSRFPYTPDAADRKYITDLVPKNGDGYILDGPPPSSSYPDTRLVFPPRIRSSKFYTQGKVHYTAREVFVDGSAIFSPVLPKIPNIAFTENSFREILGVSPIATTTVEDSVEYVLYVYYFIWDRGRDLGSSFTYRMQEVSGVFSDTLTSKICFLCCDSYRKVGSGAWSMDKQTVLDIPEASFKNGTPKGFRSLVFGATPLSFTSEGVGVSIVTIRSIAARFSDSSSDTHPKVMELTATTGIVPESQNINYGHAPKYPLNSGVGFGWWLPLSGYQLSMYTPYYGILREDAWVTFRPVYLGDSVLNAVPGAEGTPLVKQGLDNIWKPFWQEELNYTLVVVGDTAVFTIDVNTMQVNVNNVGGCTLLPSIYALGRSRLLCAFETSIYVP